MKAAPPADAPARLRAASDFSCNLVVQAGAGSGKTSLLVERALQALARGIVQPSQLVAITFTEKAAAEMLIRLASGLDDLRALTEGHGEKVAATSAAARAYPDLRARHGLDDDTIRTRVIGALQQLHRLPVKTLHTFCADILRAHPRAAGVDPSFKVDSGEKRALLFQQEWDRFLADELGGSGTRQELWDRLLTRLTVAQIGSLAGQLAGFKVPLDVLSQPAEETLARNLLRTRVRPLMADVRALLDQPDSLTRMQGPVVQGLLQALAALDGDGFAACRQVLMDNPDLAARLHASSGLRPGTKTDAAFQLLFKATIKSSLRILRGVARTDAALGRDVAAALEPFVRSFRQAYLQAGLIDFDGMLTLTRDLLLQDTQVREAVRRRYRLLLVDEFQDTDPVQYDIVLLLTEEDGGIAEDPYTARLSPGRLFIVGDPKQSIYRFRGADYASFKRAVDRVGMDGGQHLDLTVNFRSTEAVLAPINSLFQDPAVWTDSPYQPEYVPIHAFGDQDEVPDAPAVELWNVETEAGTAPGRRRDEADALARELQRMGAKGECSYSEITILFRAFSNIDLYLRALRRAGVPFVVDGGSREFDQRREVEDLVSILRALARPGDPIALLAFLRSPSGGVPDTELSTYSGGDGSWNWSEGDLPDDASCPRLHAAIRLLRRLADETRLLPADGVIGHVIRHSPLLPLSAAAHEGTQRVANLRRLGGLAIAMARDGSLDLNDVLDALQDAGRKDLEGDSPLADEQEEAVRIMTVHKAKGLENGVVIIPDLARRDQIPGRRDLTAHAPFLPAGGRILALDMGEYCSPAWVWHQAEEESHEQAEELRVLYVALTRARHRLILMSAGDSGSTWSKALSAWGYNPDSLPGKEQLLAGGKVRHRSVPGSDSAHHRDVHEAPDAQVAVAGWEQAAESLRRSSQTLLRHPSGLHEERAQRLDGDRNHESAGSGRAIGILLHRALERAVTGTSAELLAQLRGSIKLVARECNVDPGNLGRKGEDLLESFIGSPLHQRLLSSQILGREVPLLIQDGNGVTWQGSLDLLLRDDDGRIVVVDFKTDHETDADSLLHSYGDQLAVYAAAVMTAMKLPDPPVAELWLLRSGEALAVPVEDRLQRLKLGPSGS